jgi:hypothetical protein
MPGPTRRHYRLISSYIYKRSGLVPLALRAARRFAQSFTKLYFEFLVARGWTAEMGASGSFRSPLARQIVFSTVALSQTKKKGRSSYVPFDSVEQALFMYKARR